jgi:hypothetical protein
MSNEQKIQVLEEILTDLKGDLSLFKGQGLKAVPEAIEMVLGLIAMYAAG